MFHSREKRIFAILLSFFLGLAVLNFSACSDTPQETVSQTSSVSENPTLSAASETVSSNLETQPPQFTIATLSLGENLSVDYPQISASDYDEVNSFLRQTVEEVVQTDLSEQASEVSADLAGEVTYWDGRILCFVLEGIWNVSSAAHPTTLWIPILMDLESRSLVSLADLLPLETSFFTSFRQAYQEQIVLGLEERLQTDLSQEADTLQQLLVDSTDEEIRRDLSQTALESGRTFHGFLTESGVGISVALPHALGDHFEVYVVEKP